MGLLLIMAGGGIEGGSVAFLQRGTSSVGWLSLTLGLVTLGQGVWLVGRRDRRRDSPERVGQEKSSQTGINA